MIRLTASICIVLLSLMPASAQSRIFETCSSRSECAAATVENIRQSRDLVMRQRFQDAAQYLYPVLAAKNDNLSTQSRLDASFALTNVLSEAELFGYAAMEARTLNQYTSAPSSNGLLHEARLLDLAGERDEAGAAYLRAETLAVAAANLQAVDELIQDYANRGDVERSETLRSGRRDIAVDFDRLCSEARCRSSVDVPSAVQSTIRTDFPSQARRQRLSGTCQVSMNVSETGQPLDIKTNCSDPVFNDSAYEAASRARFSPRFANGAPRPDYDIIITIDNEHQ